LEQLQAIAMTFEQQHTWHFFSASLLVVYEGAARTAAEARARVRMIDFAHSFRVAAFSHHHQQQQQQQQQQYRGPAAAAAAGAAAEAEAAEAAAVERGLAGPTGRDQNFLDGLNSLIAMLHVAMQPER
jgi:hypothetical protein